MDLIEKTADYLTGHCLDIPRVWIIRLRKRMTYPNEEKEQMSSDRQRASSNRDQAISSVRLIFDLNLFLSSEYSVIMTFHPVSIAFLPMVSNKALTSMLFAGRQTDFPL